MNKKFLILTQEQQEYMKQFLADYPYTKVAEIMYKKYNIKLEQHHIWYYKKKFNIKRKENPGSTGHIPINKKEVGYEYINAEGYVLLKISQPNKWVYKHKYIWEKQNGKIPNGYNIIFLDGDRSNFNIDNLMLVKTEDMLMANNICDRTNNKELTKTTYMVAQLMNKTKELKKR